MAERERALTPPYGGVFVPRAQVMDADDVRRAITAHGPRDHRAQPRPRRRGRWSGCRPAGCRSPSGWPRRSTRSSGADVPVGTLDVAFYRDDIGLRPVLPEAVTDIPVDLTGTTVVLVDDVLFTGRTVRAALNALDRLRPGPGRPAGGDGRPGPPGAADPARLRRQEPAHPARRDGRRQRRRASSLGDVVSQVTRRAQHLLLDRRPRRRRHRRGPAAHRLLRRGQRAGPSRRCRPCGARPWSRCSSRTRPAPGFSSRRRPSGCRPTP